MESNLYIILWEIWKERNKRIFHDQDMTVCEITNKIKACIVETLNSHLRKIPKEEGSFSEWDGLMKKSWKNLINPPLMYKKKNKEVRDKYRWIPPSSGWTKLNFDGASRGNPGTARIGCIINNDSENWITKRAKSIGSTTNNLVELEALQEGLQICLNLNISKLIIEGDS